MEKAAALLFSTTNWSICDSVHEHHFLRTKFGVSLMVHKYQGILYLLEFYSFQDIAAASFPDDASCLNRESDFLPNAIPAKYKQ